METEGECHAKTKTAAQHRAADGVVPADERCGHALSGLAGGAHRRVRHWAVSAGAFLPEPRGDLRRLRHPLCRHAPCGRGTGTGKPGRHPHSHEPLSRIWGFLRPGRGNHPLGAGGAPGLPLDPGCADSFFSAHRGLRHALRFSVRRALGVLHRLRPGVEADACPFRGAGGGHRPRDVLPEPRAAGRSGKKLCRGHPGADRGGHFGTCLDGSGLCFRPETALFRGRAGGALWNADALHRAVG